jgi:cytochrome c-type biogenesis protein CcmH
VDLRRQIEELAAAGRSDREIVEYLTARYGDFIRYRPPFDVRTLVLWLGPALMLFGGALWLRRVIVASRSGSAAGDLSDAERALAGRLLAVEPRSKPR